MPFAAFGLSAELVRAVAENGYREPTAVQRESIPPILAGRDVLVGAQTGTGKTAGFTLPLLHRLMTTRRQNARRSVRALILVPTRELAAQVAQSVATYGRHLPLRSAVVFGGVSINPQIDQLRRGVDVLIATPGRLLDLAGQNAADLSRVEILVLDEADRMLDMGFIRDIRKILALLPPKRQNLLFSATFSDDMRRLADGLLDAPARVQVAARNVPAERIEQRVHPVDRRRKAALLSHLIASVDWRQVLVFTRTKHGANRLARHLEGDGLRTAAIHGNKTQTARTRALADFKRGTVRVLVATDVASRGLDIDQLPHVVNFELPHVPESYVHRIGRTARAGAEGIAISLCGAEERPLLRDIERLTRQTIPSTSRTGDAGLAVLGGGRGHGDARPARGHGRPHAPRPSGQRNGSSQGRGHGHANGHGNGQDGSQRNGTAKGARNSQRRGGAANAHAARAGEKHGQPGRGHGGGHRPSRGPAASKH